MNEIINSIIARLNEAVKDISFKGNHGHFHKLVREAVSVVKVADELKLCTWHVRATKTNSDGNYAGEYDILCYNRDFEKDKRTGGFDEKGKFSNVRFELCNGIDGEKTLAENIEILKHKDLIAEAELLMKEKQGLLTSLETVNNRLSEIGHLI